MRAREFKVFMEKAKHLSKNQINQVVNTLSPPAEDDTPIRKIELEFALSPKCPLCSCSSAVKCGRYNGLQRYKCKECGRTFNALSGTSLSRLRRKDIWEKYCQALSDNLSLTKAAACCNVARTTAFRWRHRFLQMSTEQKQCTGITEIDETYFRESYKGKKVLHRAPRRRGGLHIRGLSKEQIPVVVARDRRGNTCDAVLKARTARDVAIGLSGKIHDNSLLCIDKSRTLVKFAKNSGLAYELVNAKQRRGREKVFHLQTVTAYHSRLKSWIAQFRGVATDRLPNYLTWRRLHEEHLPKPADWLLALANEHLRR